MSEIIENGLFIGDINDANNNYFLTRNKITAIICVAENAVIRGINQNIKIYQYNLSDDNSCNITSYFDEIFELIEKEDVVLVNCIAGISRSTTVVLAYLMKCLGMTLKDAYIVLLSKRRIICPNKYFVVCLLKYEEEIYSKNSLTYRECINLLYHK